MIAIKLRSFVSLQTVAFYLHFDASPRSQTYPVRPRLALSRFSA